MKLTPAHHNLLVLLARHEGFVTYARIKKAGIHPITVATLADSGVIRRTPSGVRDITS